MKCIRHGTHYFDAHLQHLKMIKDKSQRVWVMRNCLITHFLGYKAIRGLRQEACVHPNYLIA